MIGIEMRQAATLLALLIVFVGTIKATSLEQVSLKDDDQQQAASRTNSKFVVMPSGLTRFLYYNSRPAERQVGGGGNGGEMFGYKRSLDSLTGVTIGKRSPSVGSIQNSGLPMEYINFEPLFGRQYGHSLPRMYDMRWAPLDALESSSSSSSDFEKK